ncbi:MAG: hypothetical protein KDB00_28485 [Planctomycetales bacterium]|nr:hypothetical protein [Planctomycetales bacterium]
MIGRHPHRAGMKIALVFSIWFCSAPLIAVADPSAQADVIDQRLQSGPVDVRLTLTPKSPVIGDTVTLTIRVTAEDGVEVLMPDFGEALQRFSIVDFAPRQTIDDQGRTVATQTYRLDPPSSGRHVIPPILIEYVDRREGKREAPEGLDAYEILTDRIPFQVQSVVPEDASADLKPPLGELAPLPEPSKSNWPWWAALAVVGIVATFLAARWIAAIRRVKRRRSAYDVAMSRLKHALDAPRKSVEQIDRFYVALSYIIRQYIEDRFEMRAPELTTEEFLTSIGKSPDFSGEHQGLLRSFLKQADLVKFAGAQPSASEISQAIGKVEQFLEETRENSPLVAEDSDDA